jgi:hypothetical protein
MAFVGCCGASGVRPSALAAGIAAKASAAARGAIGPAAIAAWAQERAARAGLIAEAVVANAVHTLRSPPDPDLRVVVAELAERLAEAEARLAEGLNMSRTSGSRQTSRDRERRVSPSSRRNTVAIRDGRPTSIRDVTSQTRKQVAPDSAVNGH